MMPGIQAQLGPDAMDFLADHGVTMGGGRRGGGDEDVPEVDSAWSGGA